MKTAAISIGNTHIHAAILDGTRVVEKRKIPTRFPDAWPAFIDWLRAGKAPMAAASVNPSAAVKLEAMVPGRLRIAGRDLPIPMENRTAKPEQTGHDRLLNGWAAARLYGPPLLVVDFGTAFTFNRIGADGAFLGGAIAPGLGLAARALREGCAQLPEVGPPEAEVPLMGRDTESAVRSGIFNGYIGLVETLLRRFLCEAEEGCRVIATGGDAEYFARRLGLFDHVDPDLLLKGIALAFQAESGGP